jgi:hypothetical protein
MRFPGIPVFKKSLNVFTGKYFIRSTKMKRTIALLAVVTLFIAFCSSEIVRGGIADCQSTVSIVSTPEAKGILCKPNGEQEEFTIDPTTGDHTFTNLCAGTYTVCVFGDGGGAVEFYVSGEPSSQVIVVNNGKPCPCGD